MPSKKKKYNARFPAGRIKKIMQTDEEIGKVAQAVPVIISRTLELFVESLLKRAMQITSAKNAKTLTPTHMKQCILSESRFDFLKDLVKGIPDVSSIEDECSTPCGNISPGVPLSATTGYTSFRFHHTPDTGSSRSSSIASQSTMLQSSQPKFYKEIPIGGESLVQEKASYENVIPPPLITAGTVIQHTGSHLSNNLSPQVSLHSPYLAGVNNTEGVSPIGRNFSGRGGVPHMKEIKLSNCVNRQSDNVKSASEKKQEVDAEEDLEEEEEDDEEDEKEEREVKENGHHKEYKADAIDEDYDT